MKEYERMRVLIVDDNPDVVATTALLMIEAGYTPMLAYDGQTALRLAEIDVPDVAILDLELPPRGGLDLARTFRGRLQFRRVHLVVLTGYERAVYRLAARELGIQQYLLKPVPPRELLAAVRTRDAVDSGALVTPAARGLVVDRTPGRVPGRQADQPSDSSWRSSRFSTLP